MRDAPGTARRERTSNPYPRAPSVRHRSSPARPNPDGRADPHPTVARPSRDRDCAGDARGVRVASADGLRRPVPAGHAKHFVFRLCVAERGSTPVGNVSNPFRIRTLVRIGAAFRRVGRKTEARDSFGTKLRLTPVTLHSRGESVTGHLVSVGPKPKTTLTGAAVLTEHVES